MHCGQQSWAWEATGLQMLYVELQDLVFTLMGFGVALIQSSVAMTPFLHSGTEVFTVHHCMLETCNSLYVI